MTFSGDIKRHQEKRDRRIRRIFIRTTEEVRRSVVSGSPLTGSPGQPVQTGALRASWVGRFLTPDRWRITTNLAYAPVIEAGAGLTLRSTVGGFGSVAMTRTGFANIVRFIANSERNR